MRISIFCNAGWNEIAQVLLYLVQMFGMDLIFAKEVRVEMARNLLENNNNDINNNFMKIQYGFRKNYLDTAIVVPNLCVIKTRIPKKAILISYNAFTNDYWEFWSIFKVNFTTDSHIPFQTEVQNIEDFFTGKNTQVAYFLHSFYHNNMHHFLVDNAISLHTLMQHMGHVHDESNNVLFLSFPEIPKRSRWLESFWEVININISFNRFYDYHRVDKPIVCFDKALFVFTKHMPMSPSKIWNVSTNLLFLSISQDLKTKTTKTPFDD